MTDPLPRVDAAALRIQASPQTIYDAFATPGAMERWLPPGGMVGTMLRFDWREGGSYRLRLTYKDPGEGQGKTSDTSDEVDVRIVGLDPGRRIVQEVVFDSEDPAFAGTMRMTWEFQHDPQGTLVTVRAEDVPRGIRPEDHQVGLEDSLLHLSRFVADGGVG